MKNKEFFKDKLIEIASDYMAVNKHTGEVEVCDDIRCDDCLFYGKELECGKKCKKWLNEEYTKPVLDKDEKRVLEKMLRPFKDRVKSISKKLAYDSRFDNGTYERLWIKLKYLSDDSYNWYELLRFRPGSIYKGMDIRKYYTIEELGLFQDEKIGGNDEE